MSSFGNGMQPPAALALALALNGVGKSYGGAWALEPLDLEVVEGERLAVLGPSGSGKTTLLHLIGRVIQPEQGVVEVDGQPLRDLGPGKELAALVGVMHQQLDLVPHLSVVHNIMAGRLGFWSLWRSLASLVSPRDRHLAQVALDRVGIPDKLYERTAHLSGGEQQRVALARLLVQRPKVVLADEPVASLDPARAEDLMQLLSGIVSESGNTLVASLHSIDLTRRFFSRAIGLRHGRLQFDLPVEQLTDETLNDLYDLAEAGVPKLG